MIESRPGPGGGAGQYTMYRSIPAVGITGGTTDNSWHSTIPHTCSTVAAGSGKQAVQTQVKPVDYAYQQIFK